MKSLTKGIAIFTLTTLVNAHAAELVLAGSTTVQKSVLEPCKDLIKAKTGIDITILGIGTGDGFKKLVAGEVTVSIASEPLDTVAKKYNANPGDFKEHVIKEDIIVPIVNKASKVDTLTFAQLSDLHTGKVKDWSEVGGAAGAVTIVTSHAGSATRDVFNHIVMKKAPYVEGAREVKTTREEVNMVSKMAGAIGAVSETFVKQNPIVKVVKTDKIARPLSFITKGAPSADVQKVFDVLKTPEAQKLFQ